MPKNYLLEKRVRLFFHGRCIPVDLSRNTKTPNRVLHIIKHFLFARFLGPNKLSLLTCEHFGIFGLGAVRAGPRSKPKK